MVEESKDLAKSKHSSGLNHAGQKYLEYQLSWFGKVYCQDDDVTFADKDKAKKGVITFLEKYAKDSARIEDPEIIEAFQNEFTALCDAAFSRADKNKKRVYKFKKMNDLLCEHNIGYKIEGAPQKGPWTVIRFDWKNERPESL